ncbi:MAG: TlyA family RNA methyltransferase [Peptococcaceae bacterium]|nr:TlyA family RNA methyltransferase [Peptococcaceae bacterium]
MTDKARLDIVLVRQGLAESREKAQALIMAGQVFAGEERLERAAAKVPADLAVTVRASLPYVSRGGLKLERALESFDLDLAGQVVADLGASTGGFTDCALQNGAKKVYAVDVGYGQLHWKLRQDERVVCLERVNARYMTEESLPEPVDVVVCDVAFISLTKIFPAMVRILRDGGRAVVLVKPQFEAGADKVGKKGVVRDAAVHRQVLIDVLSAAESCGFVVEGLDVSPIAGAKGNKEFLACLRLGFGNRG